jgi:glycosyltransferase involved in cell wall biosynthesis
MKRRISLVFDVGGTVEEWYSKGLFDREKRIFEEFVKRGYASKVYWLGYGAGDRKFERYLDTDKIKIVPKPLHLRPFLYSFSMPLTQSRVFQETDIIRTVQLSAAWTALFASKLYKKALVARSGYTWSLFAHQRNHSERLDILASLIERLVYKACDAAITSTKAQKAYVAQRYNIKKAKVFVVPNYVDTDIFKPSSAEQYENRVVFVGRLEKQKNLQGLVEALAGLDYQLDIYGSGSQRDNLETMARRLNVKIHFAGNVPNTSLPEILAGYPLFVLPSLYEGMPKSLLEAMACGLAVLGTDVAGTNEIITHKENGWLVGSDPSGLRTGIQVLMGNEQLRRSLGGKATQCIREKYSLDSVVEMERRVYEFAMKRA